MKAALRNAIESLEPRRLLSLAHLYTFNDGTASDSVGGAHGTLANGAVVIDGWLTLTNGTTPSGSSPQHAVLPGNLLPAAGGATVAVWYTTSSVLQNGTRVFDLGNGLDTTTGSSLGLTPRSTLGDARATLRPAGSTDRIATRPGGTNNGFAQMAAVVIDTAAGLLRLYVNGIQTGTGALSGASSASITHVTSLLGRSLSSTDIAFTGAIDEFRVYHSALDADAIWSLHGNGAVRPIPTTPAKQMEDLDRGLVVVRRTTSQAYIGWRMLGNDPGGITFNVYRSAGGGAWVKLNGTPVTQTTDFVDTSANFALANSYEVRAVIGGVEQPADRSFTLPASTPVQQFLNVPLQIPPGGTTPTGEAYTYTANDASIGDLDGDGRYEIILKWEPTNAKDNSQSGYTGNVYIDAYTLEGSRLWRIDLGRNVRAGAHYTQVMVYDLDGDGRAEIAMRTAPGTIDGTGTPVLLGSDTASDDYRNSSGYIITGPEYLTIFSGLTGANLATVPFQPARGSASQWGDSYGNRVDRFLSGIAYLDGQRPSLIMARGYYGPQSSSGQARNEVVAYDFREGTLSQRWHFRAGRNINNNINLAYIGQGAHSLSIADVDGDGRDEVIYGAATINSDGTPRHSTGLGHGDALHVSDMIPTRPGLEVFMVHEGPGSNGNIGAAVRDASTGQIIFSIPSTADVGRGVALDIDPNHPGYEYWATTTFTDQTRSVYNSAGQAIYASGNIFVNFGAWWDADPRRELLDGTTISKWNSPGRANFDLDPATGGTQGFAPNASSNNGTKSTPALSADILGDWREEVIWRRSDNTALMIFTSIISATTRLPTLMHDAQYRTAIAWQNTAYNQPPHPGFFLGDGMRSPPRPNIYFSEPPEPLLTFDYQAETSQLAGGILIESNHPGFRGTGFTNFPTIGGSATWTQVEGGAGGPATLFIRHALGTTTSRTGNHVVNGITTPITFQPTGAWTTWIDLQVSVQLNPGATNTIRLESTGEDLANIDEIRVLAAPDETAPVVTSSRFDFGQSPHKLVFEFSEDVGPLVEGSMLTVQRSDGTPVTVVQTSYDALTREASFVFAGVLADGVYQATLPAGAVEDAWGNALAEASSLEFFVLTGDADRDRAVGFSDLLILAQNFGQPGGFEQGDFDYDGVVGFGDLLLLAQRFGQTLITTPDRTPVRRERSTWAELEA